ncbi:MAG: isochorismatase family protein, partial [Gammaproteobacteria bacterium]|nr:isochorismatase family protein [Gammaproteobacteria bacterium]
FDRTGLGGFLDARGIRCVVIGGLAQDVCVRATALDAARAGFKTILLAEATRPVDPAAADAVLAALRLAGAQIA